MIAVRRLWCWRVRSDGSTYIEVTEPGERCDWTAGGAYEKLGWVVHAEHAALPLPR